MQITVEDELVRGLRLTPEEARVEIAVGLFSAERVTLGRAAEIAGVSVSVMMKELGRRKIPLHYGLNEWQEDLKTIEEILRR